MLLVRSRLALFVSVLAGCAPVDPGLAQPAGWDDAIALPRAVDLDPDPHVVEIEIVARLGETVLVPGTVTPLWTYDGASPGPLIEAHVGDRLIVHFRNELPDETTIHWHGVRVPNAMDGVPTHHTPAVPPGGTFDYDFVLPDEGLYWYHPHVRSAQQVDAGLHGVLLVRADDEPEMDELVMMLSDLSLDAAGQPLPHDVGGDLATLFGREGNHLLVNGREGATLHVRNGVPVRLRIVNAAISRYFQLELPGHVFRIVGGDRGISPQPRAATRLLVLPGQRVDAIVEPQGSSGDVLPLRWIPYDRGYGSTEFRDPVDLLHVSIEGPPRVTSIPVFPARTVAPLDTTGATSLDVSLTQATVDGHLVMSFTGIPGWDTTPLTAHVGDTQIWTFHNTIAWAHPIHLHGFFFQALDATGHVVPEWLDTIDVPVDGQASFVVHFDERPGMWMMHCHILDHADAGMMGMIDLQP